MGPPRWFLQWFHSNGFMASLLRSMIKLVDIVSDVSCRYSLGTNPRGVKDYTLATNRVEIVCLVILLYCYPCMHYSTPA
jgi:hypothetical protein